MQIVQDNYNKDPTPTPPKDSWKLVCEECESVLNFSKEDVEIGAFGIAQVFCPLCGAENQLMNHPEVEEEDGFFDCELTKDNVEFPKHFYYSPPRCDNEEVLNAEVKDIIKRGIEWCRRNCTEDSVNSYSYDTGSMYVDIIPYGGDGAYDVIVANGYYETSIPFEDIDYESINNDDSPHYIRNTL